ncbi:hypothetical protein GTP81_07980 [Rugamonas sp. FT107W]|uniref:Uncharacterized protein n=1 Tax=Duganella vulcania TaxID=2692166 RepID=A0A845HDH0_9BURK|nr:hypothetical protein [Duganella vulcania]MYN16688.1 hypothetical protein [Duganella vulcania]
MSFNVNLRVTGHRQSDCPGPGSCIPFRIIFLMASFFLVARIARAGELASSPVGGFYVLAVTHLTSMKLIIALLVPEVKRYVVIWLILFRKSLIIKIIFG